MVNAFTWCIFDNRRLLEPNEYSRFKSDKSSKFFSDLCRKILHGHYFWVVTDSGGWYEKERERKAESMNYISNVFKIQS